ncbi:MAG: hypothetical protein ACFCU3_01670 [Verrucomicrobiales bacterium]
MIVAVLMSVVALAGLVLAALVFWLWALVSMLQNTKLSGED